MLPPEIVIAKLNKKFPRLWKDVDECRARHWKSWPGWCFVPRDEMGAIVESYLKPYTNDDEHLDQMTLVRYSTIMAPWRVSKSVYRFDPLIYEALVDTSLKGNLPVDLLFKMPEWAVYIETPDLLMQHGLRSHGFVASLSYAPDANADVKLSMLSFLDNGVRYISWLYVKEGISIEESITKSLATYDKLLSTMRLSKTRLTAEAKEQVPYVSKLLNLLLYICQVNSEYRDLRNADGSSKLPANPRPTKTKKGLRYFAPDKPVVWECGMRQGAELRRALSQRSESQGGTHKSPVPHTRAAHWQTYIVGKGSRKDPSKGQRVLKWIHTVLVNARRGDPEGPVVRDVD